jgi:hypothetical protein
MDKIINEINHLSQLINDLAELRGSTNKQRVDKLEYHYDDLSDDDKFRARVVQCADEKTGCRFGMAKKRHGRCIKIGSGGRNRGQTGYQIWLDWS